MSPLPKTQPITRQIYFYQIADIHDLWHGAKTPTFSVALLEKDLKALGGNARYLPVNDEYDLCLLSGGGGAFQFGKARKTDMARIEVNGVVKPLTLNHGEKLFDCIHVVFFPDGLVGAEFSLVGPKITALTEYLVSKLTSCMPVAFDRLVNRNVMERLEHVRDIKLIEMRVDTSRSEVLAPFGNWTDASTWMKDELGVGSVELTLRAGTTAHRPLQQRALDAVRQVFADPNLRDAADKFRISVVPEGSTMTVSIDLLDDKLMASVDIPRHVYRNPDRHKELMYTKIRSTYAALRQDLLQAARIISEDLA